MPEIVLVTEKESYISGVFPSHKQCSDIKIKYTINWRKETPNFIRQNEKNRLQRKYEREKGYPRHNELILIVITVAHNDTFNVSPWKVTRILSAPQQRKCKNCCPAYIFYFRTCTEKPFRWIEFFSLYRFCLFTRRTQ